MSQLAPKSPIAVIKVGGDILLDKQQTEGLCQNVAQLIANNWRVIILHGGGPQVSSLQSKLGIKPRKIGGRRITSKEDLTAVKQVLCGEVNVNLVSALQANAVNAFGCHGASGNLIQAVKRPPRIISGGGPDPIDFGEVGDVTGINTALLTQLLNNNVVPVIASLGINPQGDIFNINADTTVVQIAKHLSANLLIFVTGIGGIFKDINNPKSRIAQLNPQTATEYISNGVITDGMIPKVEEALSLLESGVDTIAIVDTRQPKAFASIAESNVTYGTQITR